MKTKKRPSYWSHGLCIGCNHRFQFQFVEDNGDDEHYAHSYRVKYPNCPKCGGGIVYNEFEYLKDSFYVFEDVIPSIEEEYE
jgi:NAD-dependent SIR2 family protein deacetylase